MMKYQRGTSLSGLLMWSTVLVLVAVLGMKVVPTVIEYYKILNNAKAVVAKARPDSTVTELRAAFDKFADVDMLNFPSSQLDISKSSGKIVIDVAYEKRIPLFANVSLVIDYKGSTAGQ